MTGKSPENQQFHHDVNTSRMKRQENDVEVLKSTVTMHSNPFETEEPSAVNIISSAFMPQDIS